MTREQIANAALWPIDFILDKSVTNLEKLGLLQPATDFIYNGIRKTMLANFKMKNDLEILGVENVPQKGGVILASNHQSWLDVQVIGASCPRRVHFIAKSEFQTWPVLRHLIKLTESVFIHRGGDDNALEMIVDALRQGWAISIFPEGTIPGEEDVPRVAVDPRTGLLPGYTGVARLALRAKVPIIPVGLSGTGRAFPPEIYPRLELLRFPASSPIRIRFGEPITLEEYEGREQNREVFREITDRVMRKISFLVDHRSNYAPIEIPIADPPRYEHIGVLLLHGFTSHLNTVNGLIPFLKEAGITYEMPILRGHGTRYQDLSGVTAKDWYIDAERALIKLWNRVDRVVIVGLSMGGLVGLELSMRHPDKIAGLVTVAACLKFADPLTKFTDMLSKFVRFWPSPNAFNDLSLKSNSRNYEKFATSAFASLYQYSQEIAERLPEVHVPIRILQSKKDQITAPQAANIIYEKVSSQIREIVWYQESGHEMMQDCEAESVFVDIMEFIHRFEKQPQMQSLI